MEADEENAPSALAPGVAPPQRIEAEGLVLRRWTADDLPARFEAISASYEPLHAWMDWMREPPTLEGQRAWDEFRGHGWPDETGFNYGVFDSDTAHTTVLGAISALDRIGPAALEIGYWCHVAHTGKGVITRGVRALTGVLLALDGIDRVEIHCDEANIRSAAIPRRLGYRLDRIEDSEITAPNETGRDMIWIKERERP